MIFFFFGFFSVLLATIDSTFLKNMKAYKSKIKDTTKINYKVIDFFYFKVIAVKYFV